MDVQKERVGRMWVWSSRAWCLYVGLELGRLGLEFRDMTKREKVVLEKKEEEEEEDGSVVELREEKDDALVTFEKDEESKEMGEQWMKWRNDLAVNAAYAPMTVHYSLEDGILSEGPIAALGCVVAWCTFGRAWKDASL